MHKFTCLNAGKVLKPPVPTSVKDVLLLQADNQQLPWGTPPTHTLLWVHTSATSVPPPLPTPEYTFYLALGTTPHLHPWVHTSATSEHTPTHTPLGTHLSYLWAHTHAHTSGYTPRLPLGTHLWAHTSGYTRYISPQQHSTA
eukprot:297846-Chlamydomonas_euryale.AAC.16